ncbi:MAG: FAD-dependent oxidoreductase [Paraclostridium sordellii]
MKKFLGILSVIIVIVLIGIFILNKENKNKMITQSEENKNKSIIVLGSEPESITAAVTAARLGYHVDMITQDNNLGGLFTEGMLTALDLNYVNGDEILHEGFFTEFYNSASNGHNLDLKKTQEFFNEVVKSNNISLVKGVTDITPIVDKNNNKKAVGVSYNKDGKIKEVRGSYIFDGSYEAEYTRKMGVEYRTGRSEFGQPNEYAAAGVMFSVKDVNWNEIKKALKNDNDPNTGVTGNAAWGFAQMYKYIPKNELLKMRGLNISRQDDGSVVLNALLAFKVNPLDKESYNKIIDISKQEVPHIVEYMRKNLPGFENAKEGIIAKELYIREGVRIVGDYTLNGYDIIAHKKFNDVIGFASYPSDLQTTYKEGYGNAMNGNSIYEIPLSSMLPKNIENVVVLGRNASFDVVAHGSARTVPVLMNIAQGAVHAVDYALDNNINLRDVRDNHMDEVHKEMKEVGKMKFSDMPKNPYEGHYAEKYIKHLRVRGLLGSKYKGSIPLDEKANKSEIKNIVNLIKEHSNVKFDEKQNQFINNMSDNITKQNFVKLASILFNKDFKSLNNLKEAGILNKVVYDEINKSKYITNAQIYVLFSEYIDFIQPNFKEDIEKQKLDVIEK